MCIDVMMIDNEDSDDGKGKIIYPDDISEEQVKAFIAICPDSLRVRMVQNENGTGIVYIPRDSLPDEIFWELGEFFGDSVKVTPIKPL